MSSSENQALARGLYDDLGSRAFDAAAERVADSALVLNVATGDIYRGTAGFLEFVRGWGVAFPDLRIEHLRLVADEGHVAAEYEIVGTHTGPLVTPRGHIPPTAMEVQLRCADVLEVHSGRITNIRTYFDSVTLLRQLGIVPGSPIHAPDRRAPLDLYAQPVESHAPLRHKVIVQRYLQDVFNRQDPAAASDTCARQYHWHGGSLGEARGLPEYQIVLATFFTAFPDFHLEIQDMLAEGDRVAVRYSMNGTHLGDFQGIAPTFKRVSGSGINSYRFEESRIVEEWWQGDILVLLQQMNAAPSSVRIGP
jgi:predicted ester cyclase